MEERVKPLLSLRDLLKMIDHGLILILQDLELLLKLINQVLAQNFYLHILSNSFQLLKLEKKKKKRKKLNLPNKIRRKTLIQMSMLLI